MLILTERPQRPAFALISHRREDASRFDGGARWLIRPGKELLPMRQGVIAIGLQAFVQTLLESCFS